MKVATKHIPGVMKAGYDRFVEANNIQDTEHMRAGFFAGAAVALAAMDAGKDTVEAVTRYALDAMSA